MSRDEIMYLQDIAQSCEKILRFTAGLTQLELKVGLINSARQFQERFK